MPDPTWALFWGLVALHLALSIERPREMPPLVAISLSLTVSSVIVGIVWLLAHIQFGWS